MTKKRFRVNELVKYNYSEIGEYIDENHTDNPLRNDEICELLNELNDENEQLKKQNKELEEKLTKTQMEYNGLGCECAGLEAENKEIKQLLHTIIGQIEVNDIGLETERYGAVIYFSMKEFQKILKIYKGELE